MHEFCTITNPDPEQPSPSVEIADEELVTQKQVKLADIKVEALAVASGEEVKKHCCLRSCGCALRPLVFYFKLF
jgi:hypothetical protein